MAVPKDSFAELATMAITCGRQEDLPALASAGISSVTLHIVGDTGREQRPEASQRRRLAEVTL